MNSIRRRLTARLLAGFGVLWAGAGIALYVDLRAGLVAEFDATLLANAHALQAVTRQHDGRAELDFPGEFIPGFEGARAAGYFEMRRGDGTTLERSSSLGTGHLPHDAGAANTPRYADLRLPNGRPGRAVTLRFVPQSSDEAADAVLDAHDGIKVILTLAILRAGLDQHLNALATTLLVVAGLLAAATGLIVPAVVRRGLSPLDSVADQASRIDGTSLQLRFPSSDLPAELQPIGARLNELLARLQASFERERQFSADVAHELRTPIAELQSLAEVAIRWPDEPDTLAHALQEALEIARQMEATVSSLLSLARCDAGLQRATCVPIQVAAVLREAWNPLADLALTRRLAVTWHIDEGDVLDADPVLFRAILANLLSNAVEYSPDGGAIDVCVESDPAHRGIAVTNTVHDLGPADVPHLFDRFWRRDPARTGSTHSGLGLAVAKAFAAASGLGLTAQLSPPDRLTLELRPEAGRPAVTPAPRPPPAPPSRSGPTASSTA